MHKQKMRCPWSSGINYGLGEMTNQIKPQSISTDRGKAGKGQPTQCAHGYVLTGPCPCCPETGRILPKKKEKAYFLCVTPYFKIRTVKPSIFLKMVLRIFGMSFTYEFPPEPHPEQCVFWLDSKWILKIDTSNFCEHRVHLSNFCSHCHEATNQH